TEPLETGLVTPAPGRVAMPTGLNYSWGAIQDDAVHEHLVVQPERQHGHLRSRWCLSLSFRLCLSDVFVEVENVHLECDTVPMHSLVSGINGAVRALRAIVFRCCTSERIERSGPVGPNVDPTSTIVVAGPHPRDHR